MAVDGGAQYKDVLAKDSCEFYSKFVQKVEYKGIPIQEYIDNNLILNSSINEWLCEYLYENPSNERIAQLQNNVLGSTFYLILHEIKKWNLSSHIFEEAVQNSCIAVIDAMTRFDPFRNVKFTTYLIQNHIIKTAIRKAISQCSIVRIPAAARKKTARKAKKMLRVGEEPDTVPFGQHVISWDEVRDPQPCESSEPADTGEEALDMDYGDMAFMEEIDYNRYGGDIEYLDVEEVVFTKEVMKMCEVALETDEAKLTEIEKITLKHKFGLFGTTTLKSKDIVGLLKAYGRDVSQPRVCQYYKNALRKLLKYFRQHNDKEFTGVYAD